MGLLGAYLVGRALARAAWPPPPAAPRRAYRTRTLHLDPDRTVPVSNPLTVPDRRRRTDLKAPVTFPARDTSAGMDLHELEDALDLWHQAAHERHLLTGSPDTPDLTHPPRVRVSVTMRGRIRSITLEPQ
jgi:hypothetical protein